jgi:hypothetical protein
MAWVWLTVVKIKDMDSMVLLIRKQPGTFSTLKNSTILAMKEVELAIIIRVGGNMLATMKTTIQNLWESLIMMRTLMMTMEKNRTKMEMMITALTLIP